MCALEALLLLFLFDVSKANRLLVSRFFSIFFPSIYNHFVHIVSFISHFFEPIVILPSHLS